MVSMKVSWARESFVGGRYPFNVPRPEKWKKENIQTLEVAPDMIYKVYPSKWDKIAKSLDNLHETMHEYIPLPQRFIITDGVRWLAIDTEGYEYPSYKSHLTKEAIKYLKRYL